MCCLQAELVDGFLAWDFDADTAATFFAQQVYHTGSRKSVIREYRKRCYIPSVLTCVYSLTYSRPVLHLLSSSRSRTRASSSSWPRAERKGGSTPTALRTSRDPEGKGAKGLGETNLVRQRPCSLSYQGCHSTFAQRQRATKESPHTTHSRTPAL